MVLRPELLFKYKSLYSDEQMHHVREIIETNQIYFPKPTELNDPMEANATTFLVGVAGSGYQYEAGKVHPTVLGLQEQFRVLSFSTNQRSPVMWSHYADDYKGCCLIFSSDGDFNDIEPVIYSDNHFTFNAENKADIIDVAIRETLRFKSTEWSYENEWRVIRKEESEIITFEADNLLGVIVGEHIGDKYKSLIVDLCKKKGIPCFITYTMIGYNTIQFAPVEMGNGFITPWDIQEHIKKKEESGELCCNEANLLMELNCGVTSGFQVL